MPNLRSQSMDVTGISLVAYDGREFSLTKADLIAHFQLEKGSHANRILATIQWVKDSIETALGREQVPQELIEIDMDDIQGFKLLRVKG